MSIFDNITPDQPRPWSQNTETLRAAITRAPGQGVCGFTTRSGSQYELGNGGVRVLRPSGHHLPTQFVEVDDLHIDDRGRVTFFRRGRTVLRSTALVELTVNAMRECD